MKFPSLSFLQYQPGEWRLNELSPTPKWVTRQQAPKPGTGWVVLIGLCVLPFLGGVGFGVRFGLLWIVPGLCLFFSIALSRWSFLGVPVGAACLWPRDDRKDAVRAYQAVLLKVSTAWLIALALFALSVEFMHYGLGDQWNPFTREIRITKDGPYWEYAPIDLLMIASGFFAITGLLWWPMYAVFEWLSVSKTIRHGRAASHA